MAEIAWRERSLRKKTVGSRLLISGRLAESIKESMHTWAYE